MNKTTKNQNSEKVKAKRAVFSLGLLLAMAFLPFAGNAHNMMILIGPPTEQNALPEILRGKYPRTSESLVWTPNGTAICNEDGAQSSPQLISDGAGGAIIVWQDARDDGGDIYAQKINSTGNTQWIPNGTVICNVIGTIQVLPQLITDGAGGAIITWFDRRNGDWAVFAQKVNSTGDTQWNPNGTAIYEEGFDHFHPDVSPQLCSDGSGGAIIIWQDNRAASWGIYAQRINSTGQVQWTEGGILISELSFNLGNPRIMSDGAGGAIIVKDFGWNIYAQRLNSTGDKQWDEGWMPVCTVAGSQDSPNLVSDDFGGAIISWDDYRNVDYDIYAQRINSTGIPQWTTNGIPVSTELDQQMKSQIASDGSGGAIITWQDLRHGIINNIYAQRINSTGVIQWTPNGTAICTDENDRYYPQLASDGAGGAIITWHDYRMGGLNPDIYAQKVNSTGILQWNPSGIAVCTFTGGQLLPQIISDGAEGAIIVWYDLRYGTGEADIYAQKIADPPSPPPDETPTNGEEELAPGISGFNLVFISAISIIAVAIILYKRKKN